MIITMMTPHLVSSTSTRIPSVSLYSSNRTNTNSSSNCAVAAAYLKKQQHFFLSTFLGSSSSSFKPLILSSKMIKMSSKKQRGFGPVCYASPLTPPNLLWISAISTAVLMFTRGTAINKSFLVPLFALHAPSTIISWIKGEYGIWTTFLALLVRLFFSIPGELELPFLTLLLVIVAPYQVMNLRGTQEGSILSLVIAGYLAFIHFSRAGSLRRAFNQGSTVATMAIICVFTVPCLLLF